VDVVGHQELVNKLANPGDSSRAMRQVRDGDDDTISVLQLQPRPFAFTPDRFFYEKHAALFRATRHEVLWSLENEVPAEVRKTNQIM
jgi:hypothetical protein